MWLEEKGFKDKMKMWWGSLKFIGTSNYILDAKLRALKNILKIWNKKEFGHVETKKGEALTQVEYWDEKEKCAALNMEECEARNGARESYKSWKKLAVQVKVNGCWHSEENDLKNSVVGAFQKLYSEEEGWRPSIDELSFMGLDSSEAEGLENPFSEEEVFATLSDLGKEKAPGPDGFTMAFWFFGGMCLYKLLAKVLANRIKKVMGKVISEPQNAFVEGRQIFDAVLIANEAVDSRLKSNQEKSKAGLEKIQRHFLWKGGALEQRPHLVRWNLVCLERKKCGLGVRNLALMNKALLGKWNWRFAIESEALWKQAISHKYGVEEGDGVLRPSSEISSWYQSQFSETLIPSGISYSGHHSFRSNLSGHISIRSSLSLSLSHSGHQSLFSEPREKTLSGQSNRRQKTPPPATFPANFSGDGFFLHRKERLEEISKFVPKHRNQKPIHAPAHARFSGRRLHLTRRRVRAREPLSGNALPPPGSPDARPATLPTCLCNPSPALPARALKSVLLPFRSMTKYGMASSQVSSVTSPKSGGRSEIPNLGGNDSSPILITGHKLNGHNYLQWSQSVLLFICGKGKDEYLTGEAVMPETTEPGFRKWKIENSMIMSWLINSMNNDIGENFLLFGTAKDIWDAAKETYSSSENTSELFQVESALHDFRQGEQSVTQYYNTLTRYWQQLDLFETHSWKCSDDAATYRQIVEQKRLFKFFLGLNRELDDVRGRIMGIKPLPSLREAFSEVRREESRKKVMMGSKEQPAPTLDASALAARSFNSSGGDRQKRDRPWCDYCKKPGHYKETCWKLHGKPADWKPKPRFDRDGRAHVAANSESTSVPEPSPFNKEQMEMLQKLLSQVGSGQYYRCSLHC
ncbi:hypothetical protein CK203_079178 [Vitis vinifera]|uniref:Uncharacterized protein n=1 Tax=Vitis vinifera TaxID=29760 RepID=A0A438DYM4_VITVI|nr:hypothetical protein CK203_079178 [Vitis vinifera]